MKKYKHLVFDIDGTLLDTVKIHSVSLQRAVEEVRGVKIPLEDLSFSFGIPGIRALEILGFEHPEEDIKVWIRHYDICAKEFGKKMFPGVQQVLEQLKKSGVTLGIITSKLRDEYERDANECGMQPYFDCAVTASDTERGKPHPDPMLKYMELTGARPEEILYFGDSIYDMQCGQAAGVDHVLVLWGCLNPEGIEATYRLEKPEEILSFVQ